MRHARGAESSFVWQGRHDRCNGQDANYSYRSPLRVMESAVSCSQSRLLFVVVTVTAALTMHPGTVTGQELFSFCDDFFKPAAHHRDPYEERIETERHDFTQSAITVGRHVAQIESGYTYFYKDDGHEIESAHTFPEMLLRIGLTEDIEFRLRYNYAWKFIKDHGSETGDEDLRYSLKLQITKPECPSSFIPTSALEIRASAPTAGRPFSTQGSEFSLDYIYQWQLTECSTFAGSTGFGTNGFGDFGFIADDPAAEEFVAISQSAVLGIELTEQNVMYAEWYGIFSTGLPDEYTISVFNVGIDHYVTNNLVLDIRFGLGLTNDTDDFFTGIGGGYRF